MPPITTHLVIGERIFAHLPGLNPSDRGGFLLGCALVDVHGYTVDRRTTHFAGRLDREGDLAFGKSCANFVAGLDGLLTRPRGQLESEELAFVAGYLCHLAADENWKQFDWDLRQESGAYVWTDLPTPGDVILTAFDVLSADLYADHASVASDLGRAVIPDVFSHVSHQPLSRTWDVIREHVISGSTRQSALATIERTAGGGEEEQAIRRLHETHWEDAVRVIKTHLGGVRSRVRDMVRQSRETMARLWGVT